MAKSYTYINARIRALEARMLSPVQISRMAEATDLEKAFFVLNETSYADHLSSNIGPFDFEAIIAAELNSVYDTVSKNGAGDEIVELVWRKYDYANIKILLRAFKLGLTEYEDLSFFGNLDHEDLTRYILKGEGLLPAWAEKATSEAIVAFEEERTPAAIDRVLDRLLINDFIKSGNTLLEKIGKLWKAAEYITDLSTENLLIDMLKGVKRKAFGVEPMITFWFVKVGEAKMIRQILLGKKYHAVPAQLKEKLRISYV